MRAPLAVRPHGMAAEPDNDNNNNDNYNTNTNNWIGELGGKIDGKKVGLLGMSDGGCLATA